MLDRVTVLSQICSGFMGGHQSELREPSQAGNGWEQVMSWQLRLFWGSGSIYKLDD